MRQPESSHAIVPAATQAPVPADRESRSEAADRARWEVINGLQSDSSRRGYAYEWGRWTGWLARQGRSVPDATTADVLRFLESLRAAGLAPKTCQRALAVVRAVYKRMVTNGLLAINPAREVSGPDHDRAPKTPWVPREGITAILTLPPEGPNGLRNRIVLLLLAATGLRRRDVARMRVEDRTALVTGAPAVRVVTKGEKPGIIGLSPPVAAALDRYLAASRIVSGAMFPGPNGRPISAWQVWRILKDAARRAGVDPKGVTPHALRRSFNTLAKATGVPVEFRQAAMLHSSAVTTELYDKADRQGDTRAQEAVLAQILPGGWL